MYIHVQCLISAKFFRGRMSSKISPDWSQIHLRGNQVFICWLRDNLSCYFFEKRGRRDNLLLSQTMLGKLLEFSQPSWSTGWYMQKPLTKKASYSRHLTAEYKAQQTAIRFHFTREELLLWNVFNVSMTKYSSTVSASVSCFVFLAQLSN